MDDLRPRLFAYGCSNVYGHGLSDCWNPEDSKPGPTASDQAWPQILAQSLDLDCVNHSHPGSSNKEIWWRVIRDVKDIRSRDLVIVHWSYLDRWAQIVQHAVNKIGPWAASEDHRSRAYYRDLYHGFDQTIDLLLRIQHVKLLLDDISCQKLLIPPIQFREITQDPEIPEILLSCSDDLDNVIDRQVDYACDQTHPGPKTHQQYADYLYSKITLR